MKKIKLLLLTSLTTFLFACQSSNTQLLKVVATEIPHAAILEQTRAPLLELGIRLKVEVINDYALGNPAVSNGSADANYFQHIPYFDAYNASVSASNQIANVAGIHIEPIGLYSGTKNDLSLLSDGDKIIISNNQSDYGRIVNFLKNINLVTTIEDFKPTNVYSHPDEAILTKTVNFTFQIIEAKLLVTAKKQQEAAFFFINGNYALSGGLTIDDVLVSEPTFDNPYVNIVATKKGNEQLEKIQALVNVLTSEAIRQFINETYQGSVIAAF